MGQPVAHSWLDYANSGIGVLVLGALGHIVRTLLDMKSKIDILWALYKPVDKLTKP